jgi:hypothetical protein
MFTAIVWSLLCMIRVICDIVNYWSVRTEYNIQVTCFMYFCECGELMWPAELTILAEAVD